MKKLYVEIEVDDNFEINDCYNCILYNEYNSVERCVLYSDVCPLKELTQLK